MIKIDVLKKYINLMMLYLFVIAMLYQTGSVPAALDLKTPVLLLTRVLIICIPCMCVSKICDLKQIVVLAGVMVVGLGINTAIYFNGSQQLFYKIVLISFFYIVIGAADYKKIDIENILYEELILIIIVTLFFYIAVDIFKINLPFQYISNNGSYYYREYLGIYYSYHGGTFPRLSGLFWEPGMYAIYLNLALFYYIYNNKIEKKKWQFVIIVISLLCTQSAAGYCVMAFLLASYLAGTKLFNRQSKVIITMLVGGVSLGAIGIVIVNKMLQNASVPQAYSYGLRVADIRNGFKIFLSSPIWGVGYGNDKLFRMLDDFGRRSSNGLISWMYMTGILGMIFVYFPFVINIVHKNSNEKFRQIVWVIVISIFNMCEPIYSLPLMQFFVAFEYYKCINKRSIL